MSELAYPGTDRYSMAELLAVEIARNLAVEDGKLGGVGVDSEIPAAACNLARLTVAPNMWFWGQVEYPHNMYDVQDLGMLGAQGKWGFGFNSGIQVDKFGNLNMIGIGPSYEHLKVRGPGSIGTIWVATIQNDYQFFLHHARRVFVEKVDFMSAPGFLRGGDSRWTVCPSVSRGPRLVFTPICTMDFEEISKRMRIRSVNPGYQVSDVVANTGFELVVPASVPTTKPPTDEELFILRTMVDRDGLLRRFNRLTVG